MTSSVSAFGRDANRVPITELGLQSVTSLTINASNTTVNPPIYTVVGSVLVKAIWGIVTTALSSNITAAYWRTNDQTAQVNVTVNTGTTLSSIAAGSMIVKKDLATAALVLMNNSAGRVNEPTTLETLFFSPFTIVKKTAALTQIEFVYTTTNTPATGVIQFFVGFIPLSTDGDIQGVAT